MRHTDKSLPVDSQSCLMRIEAASQAGPPPTIKTSKGMLSRGSSAAEEKLRMAVQGRTDDVRARERRAAEATILNILGVCRSRTISLSHSNLKKL